jgi:hypothetical protein
MPIIGMAAEAGSLLRTSGLWWSFEDDAMLMDDTIEMLMITMDAEANINATQPIPLLGSLNTSPLIMRVGDFTR